MGGGGAFVTSPNLVALYNGTDADGPYAIGAASFDGSVWTVYASNPVLEKGAGGTWDDDHVKDPWLLWDGSQFVCYYAGFDGTKYQVGRATAISHEGPWTKDAGNPVLTVGAGGAFDDAGLIFPTVLYEPSDTGREWKLWYGANDGTNYRIGYAYSSDGVSWTKHGQVVNIGAGGTWNDEGVVPAGIVKDGATYYLFAGGQQGTSVPRWQTGLYTFSDPEGTYTADAGNPVLEAAFNTAGTSQAIVGTISGTTGTVGDTSNWTAGEPVAIADANSDTDIRTIVSIDSGTDFTLDAAVSSTFAGADGGVVRPFTYNSVQSRTIRAAVAGGWEMFFVPFQPVEDLSPGGTKLREGSMRATASSLSGPWTIDYATGLMFPLQDGGWDNLSAENPSVIAEP
jgi:hypothetical protein